MFIASPGNPTGWMHDAATNRDMLEFCARSAASPSSATKSMAPVYDGAPHAPSFLPIAEHDDAVFVINSFSKPWAMTGWRIGWLVHPAPGPADVDDAQPPTTPAPPHFAQYGALAALSPEGDAFRGEIAGALPRRQAMWYRNGSPPEPGALDRTGRRLLRLPACRRPDGQSGLRHRSGEEGARGRGAGLGLQLLGDRATISICVSALPRTHPASAPASNASARP